MKKLKSKTDKLAANAEIIERTLDSFGIRARVAEINDEKDRLEFNIEIVMGTPIEDIEKRSRDLALALAAPGGKVDIVAPIPGRSLISIVMKKPKQDTKKKSEKYKIIRVKEKQYVTFDNFERFRNAVALVLYLLGQGIFKLADKIQSPHEVRFSKDEDEKESK